MPRLVDLRGQKFGRLTALRLLPKGNKRRRQWLCVCDCGNQTIVSGDHLHAGDIRSCGCLRHEELVARLTTHGLSRHPLHHTWSALKGRCMNPRNAEYANYGARGISVWPPWRRSFTSFFCYIMSTLGPRPRGKSLDRYPDMYGNYEPGNLRWATPRQQVINSRQRRSLPRGIYAAPTGVY